MLRNLLFSQTEKKNQMLRYNYKAFQLTDCPTISECTWFKKFVHKQNCNEKLQWKFAKLQWKMENGTFAVLCGKFPLVSSYPERWGTMSTAAMKHARGGDRSSDKCPEKKDLLHVHTPLHFQSHSRIHKCVNPLWVKITDRFAGFGVLSKYVMKNLQQSIILKREQWFMVLLPQAQSKW